MRQNPSLLDFLIFQKRRTSAQYSSITAERWQSFTGKLSIRRSTDLIGFLDMGFALTRGLSHRCRNHLHTSLAKSMRRGARARLSYTIQTRFTHSMNLSSKV